MKFMKSLDPLSLLALRLVVGLVFLYHGYPKLLHPNPGMRDFFISHGLPGYFLSLAGIIECFGALMLFAGLFTRVAGLLLAIEMGVAIWKVHSAHGIMAVNDYQFPLTLAAACFVLATVGAGAFSADNLFFGESGRSRRTPKRGEG